MERSILRYKALPNVKILAIVTGTIALAAPRAMAQTSIWTADPAHCEVDFSVERLKIDEVHGRFGRVTGELTLNEADITKSTVRMTIDVTGVNSGDEIRDEHLRSDSFFDASKFPTARFVSTSVAKNGRGLTVVGDLTLHGITQPVTLRVDSPNGPGKGTGDRSHLRYEATATITRSAFALGNSYPEPAISDTVRLVIKLDAVKKQ